MQATNQGAAPPRSRAKQRGNAAVEFGLVAIIFFTLVFGFLEVARAMYIYNTLQEVTRRAASLAVNTDFTDPVALQTLRQKAMFRGSPGTLMLGAPITDKNLQIDYLSIMRVGSTLTMTPIPPGSLPASPAYNRLNCTADQNAANCIRLVRVAVCMPGGAGTCARVAYQTIFPLIDLSVNLPASTTIMQAETLGFTPDMMPYP